MREATVDRGCRSPLTGRLDEIRRAEIHVESLVVYADSSRATEISNAVGRLPGAEATRAIDKLTHFLNDSREPVGRGSRPPNRPG